MAVMIMNGGLMISQEYLKLEPPFGGRNDREWRSHGKPRVP